VAEAIRDRSQRRTDATAYDNINAACDVVNNKSMWLTFRNRWIYILPTLIYNDKTAVARFRGASTVSADGANVDNWHGESGPAAVTGRNRSSRRRRRRIRGRRVERQSYRQHRSTTVKRPASTAYACTRE